MDKCNDKRKDTCKPFILYCEATKKSEYTFCPCIACCRFHNDMYEKIKAKHVVVE